MRDQRGGIMSKLLMVPAGIALVAGFFFLGFSVGKYKSKPVPLREDAPPLPAMPAPARQKGETYTFFKTLTDSSQRTVPIAPGSGKAAEGRQPAKQQSSVPVPPGENAGLSSREKRNEAARRPEMPLLNRLFEAKRGDQTGDRAPDETADGARRRYLVQTASYEERAMAEEEVKGLKKRGYAAFIASQELPGRGTRYRVRIGGFPDRESAERLLKRLHDSEGISPIIAVE